MMIQIFIIALAAFSIESTQVLPNGVRSLMLKQGVIGGVTNKYGNSGNLYNLDGQFSRTFDAEEILKLHPRAPELIKGLNESLPSIYELGNQVNLGSLHFSGNADVYYSAPVLAYGVTKDWTMAIAVPFARIDANVNVEAGGNNNVEQIYDALSARGGLIKPEDEAQLKELMNINLEKAFYDHLEAKNYQALEADDSWQLGDIQLVSKYRYLKRDKWTFLNKFVFNLPTGPEDDPNHLMDLPNFHRRFIEIAQVQDYQLNSKHIIGTALTYVWNLPDTIDKRVPSFEGDYLPPPEREENLDRNIGDAIRWEANWRTNWTETISSSFAYIGQTKEEDYFAGSRDYDYSLLSKKTQTLLHKTEAAVTYSSVERFLNKQAMLPFMVGYKYSDVFSGENVEKQRIHELTLMVFF